MKSVRASAGAVLGPGAALGKRGLAGAARGRENQGGV
ncbi:hypothetical protein FHX59_004138 [Paraburkholderia silvatlantica]|uniref:Uncharacterized protein n=1 Tax=Paraburkholderia silvatlantica TaxID=321895 RepID=A0ABR6FQN7_9BURK|nr:hypothetical protein [Paraburkholderia silvatlantica]